MLVQNVDGFNRKYENIHQYTTNNLDGREELFVSYGQLMIRRMIVLSSARAPSWLEIKVD